METFEYEMNKNPRGESVHEITARYNARGADGWELCGFEYGHSIWKRKVTPERVAEDARKVETANKQKSGYWFHMRDAHDNLIYIGNPVEIHDEDYPHCAWIFDPTTLGGE